MVDNPYTAVPHRVYHFPSFNIKGWAIIIAGLLWVFYLMLFWALTVKVYWALYYTEKG